MQLPDLFSRRYTKLVLLIPLLLCALLLLLTFNLVPAVRVRVPYISPTPKQATTPAPPPPPPPPKKDYHTTPTRTSFRPHALALEYHNTTSTTPLCAGFPTHKLNTIQISLKTGASASRAKLNAQLSSVCACIPNLLLFSDLDEAIAHPLDPTRTLRSIDVLANLPASYAVDNPDWATYGAQKRAHEEGSIVGAASQEGWRLDRFKFLPMVERAWEEAPGREWYVFLEDDTYVAWDNMFRWLSLQSPDSERYAGSPSPGKRTEDGETTWFAYGGTGFVLSRAAMTQLLSRAWDVQQGLYTEPRLSERFQDVVKSDCCGDSVLGWALWQKGVTLSGHWPMFNPHSIEGVPYSDLYWCQPVLTLHRVPAHEMAKLWSWEQDKREELGPDSPLLYRHLSSYFPLLAAPTRPDWDNAQWDGFAPPDGPDLQPSQPSPHDSFEACGAACRAHARCFQYTFHEGKCTFVGSARFGMHRDADVVGEGEVEGDGEEEGAERERQRERRRWMAGWDLEGIKTWMGERGCEGGPEWSVPSLTRIF